jgi:Flp pilus assembly protein TadD
VQPDFAQAHSNLANNLTAAGNIPQAVYHYEQAIHYNPADAAARYNYGSLLIRKGDATQAATHLRIAAESSNPAVRQAAMRLLESIDAGKRIR